jgi:D-glycero-alpha-D-manno-heptose-7-phosphate kinase
VEGLPAWDALGGCLSLVFLGRPHNSTTLHRQVIEQVQRCRPGAFSQLRSAAAAARAAVLGRDLAAFGRAMVAGTEAQRSLHPGLVGVDAERVIGLAAGQRALGWKVNGAGGDGGSVTVLSATAEDRQAFEATVAETGRPYEVLPVRVSATGIEVHGAL